MDRAGRTTEAILKRRVQTSIDEEMARKITCETIQATEESIVDAVLDLVLEWKRSIGKAVSS
jgi:hypothetical protein